MKREKEEASVKDPGQLPKETPVSQESLDASARDYQKNLKPVIDALAKWRAESACSQTRVS